MKEILAQTGRGKRSDKRGSDESTGADSDRTGNRGADCMFSDSTPHERGTLDEITGLAAVLRNKANTISPKVADYVDFVGTGGLYLFV